MILALVGALAIVALLALLVYLRIVNRRRERISQRLATFIRGEEARPFVLAAKERDAFIEQFTRK